MKRALKNAFAEDTSPAPYTSTPSPQSISPPVVTSPPTGPQMMLVPYDPMDALESKIEAKMSQKLAEQLAEQKKISQQLSEQLDKFTQSLQENRQAQLPQLPACNAPSPSHHYLPMPHQASTQLTHPAFSYRATYEDALYPYPPSLPRYYQAPIAHFPPPSMPHSYYTNSDYYLDMLKRSHTDKQ